MPMTGADHGDYWGHSGKAIARESAKWAGRFFGLGQRGREIGIAREIGQILLRKRLPAPNDLRRVIHLELVALVHQQALQPPDSP